MSVRPVVVLHQKPYRRYSIDGEYALPDGRKIVSVTQVLGILDKPALVHWSAKMTAEGCFRLLSKPGYELPESPEQLRADLKKHSLDAMSQRDDAAERGTAVHAALENWIGERKLPDTSAYPDAWRGYFLSLANFLRSVDGGTFVESELAVGSLTHGFAGTRDTVLLSNDPERGRVMYDLKTSKRCYPESHFRQLAAYELAGVEMGEEPTDAQAVVRLGADGDFSVHWSNATGDDFLHVLQVFRDQLKFKDAA